MASAIPISLELSSSARERHGLSTYVFPPDLTAFVLG